MRGVSPGDQFHDPTHKSSAPARPRPLQLQVEHLPDRSIHQYTPDASPLLQSVYVGQAGGVRGELLGALEQRLRRRSLLRHRQGATNPVFQRHLAVRH
jgi:hypothetical protein